MHSTRTISRRGAARTALFGAVASALLLGGCASHSKHHFTVDPYSHDYKKRHPITIGEREHTLDIPVALSTHELPRAAREAVAGFAQGYARAPAGAMRVLLPTGSPNAQSASALGSDILEALSNGGVDPSRVEILHYDATRHGAAAPVRLSYHGVAASVHECGKWTEDLGHSPQNRNYGNFGCATQKNLAAVVANPADLLGPRGTTAVDGANRANVVENYRRRGSDTIRIGQSSGF